MITLDVETRSYADLFKTGAWTYAEDISTDVVCVCWGIDDQPIKAWWPEHMPGPIDLKSIFHDVEPVERCTDAELQDLFDRIEAGELVEAHNVSFERSIWEHIMVPRYGWLEVPADQWRDTMAVANYYSMPAALDKLARALGYEQKDKAGTRLISKYSKMNLKTAWGPNPIPQDDFYSFVRYCMHDVRMEQTVSDDLGDLPDRELPYFLLDQKINHRGLYLDQVGINMASRVVDDRSKRLSAEFKEITGCTANQRNKTMEWFAAQGLPLENMTADYLEALLEEGEIPNGPARRALDIRLEINKASAKKLDAMSRARGADGRAHFQTRYHGASTGRNTGTGFQPLNMARGFGTDPEQLVRDVMYGDAVYLDMVYGSATAAVAAASRHWIKAEEGNKIVAGDYVSVEAVILACLAGETWKVEAFREGVKIYEHMGDKIYGLPAGTVTKATHPTERQDGKTGELAFGYQGALGAWLKFDSSGRHTDERIIEICKAWRQAHPNIVKLWYDMGDAAIDAVQNGGLVQLEQCDVGFEVVDEWLSMILPNGKRIWYREPRIQVGMPNWHKPKEKEDCASGKCRCQAGPKLTYMSQKNGAWMRVHTYGGKLTENLVQATSREIMMFACVRLEEAGYPIILTVYDEVVTEPPATILLNYNKHELAKIMSVMPEWAAGWPITVDPWEGIRYKK
mgnify:CR=1 FL=1